MKDGVCLLVVALSLVAGCGRRDRLQDELIEASRAGYIFTVQDLVEAGVDVNARAGAASTTALMEASRAGHLNVVEYLLARGADIDARSGINYTTPLMEAAAHGHGEVAQRLIKQGAKLDLRGPPREITHAGRIIFQGKTAFLIAVAGGHIETAKLFKAAGADIRLRDENGYSAVQVALRAGKEEMARELIRLGFEE